MYTELARKVDIVTGAGRPAGLGAAIAARLAQEGVRVIVHDVGAWRQQSRLSGTL